MRFSAREDIDVPQDEVFQALSEFDRWERSAMRNGADVVRLDRLVAPAPGMSWRVGFSWRARPRSVTVTLKSIEPSNRILLDGVSPAFEGWMSIDLVKMGPRRTRLSVILELKPRSLTSRLFLQSLQLARRRVNTRFDTAVARLAAVLSSRKPGLRG